MNGDAALASGYNAWSYVAPLTTGTNTLTVLVTDNAALTVTNIVQYVRSIAGDIRYVSLNGGHIHPFDTWENAATNIQAAIDISVDGDTVLVTNGYMTQVAW